MVTSLKHRAQRQGEYPDAEREQGKGGDQRADAD